MLRNEDWNYAAFTTAKQHRPGVNQAECLALHKPLDEVSYAFTLDQLAAVGRKNRSEFAGANTNTGADHGTEMPWTPRPVWSF